MSQATETTTGAADGTSPFAVIPSTEAFPRLHAPGAAERLVDGGRSLRPAGQVEAFSVHVDGEGRFFVRVAVLPGREPDPGAAPASGASERWIDPVSGLLPPGSLWHLVLAPDGRPERLEARWLEEGRPVELALTCFPDEVMIWRRGAEPASESLAVPPGYRLLWPPVSGRDHCLMNLDAFLDIHDRGILMVCALACRPAARGGLRARPVKLTIGVDASPATDNAVEPRTVVPRTVVSLSTPGWPEQRLTLDEAGRLARWQVDDAATVCARPWAEAWIPS